MFDTLQDRLSATFRSLRGKGRLSEADIDATCREIRIALLEADVNLSVVKDFVAAVKEQARAVELTGALNPAQQIIKIVNDELVGVLGGETRRLRFNKRPPTVIMLAGLQGAGKTTLAGKLAYWLKDQGHSPLLVAADLQRPNAVTQLQVVGQRAGVQVFAPEPGNTSASEAAGVGVGDPVGVARASILEAERRLFDVVVIDTAGRLGIDADLMQQAADIRDAVRPDEVLFVVDAMIGQDAVNTANAFGEGVGFDGVVLTKLDGDARGGAALSIARVTGKPIMFASNGEQIREFDVFHPDRMASRILGMGDMLTLIEQAERTFDAEQSAKAAAKLASGGGKEFGLADFLQQMQMVRKMGPLSKIFGMLPGMGEIKDQIAGIDEKEIDRIEAMIHSMTPAERDNPKIIDGSRRARIAKGSGVEVSQVNNLVTRFFEARKMMNSMASGKGMPGHARDAGHGCPPAAGQATGQEEEPQGLRQPGQAQRPGRRGPAGRRSGGGLRRRSESGRVGAGDGQLRVAARAAEDVQAGQVERGLPLAERWRLDAVLLPAGEQRELWVVDGLISTEPVAGARALDGAFAMPALVDAHCHVGLDANGAVPQATGEQQAYDDRAAGALLLRDAGSPADTRWIDDRDDLPRIIRAGRHIARPKRYLRNFADEVEPAEVIAAIERQAARSDGWIKLVGDWIDREVGDLTPLWPAEVARAAIERAHELGCRVTAHVFGEQAATELVAAGIDGIEHGTGITEATIALMAQRQVALVPTLIQLENFESFAAAADAKFPAYAAHMRSLYATRLTRFGAARDAGVPIFAGTDAGGYQPHGRIRDEIDALAGVIGAEAALAAGSWGAREWLGRPARLEHGAPADLLVLDADPRRDLSELRRPRHVLLRGRRVGP